MVTASFLCGPSTILTVLGGSKRGNRVRCWCCAGLRRGVFTLSLLMFGEVWITNAIEKTVQLSESLQRNVRLFSQRNLVAYDWVEHPRWYFESVIVVVRPAATQELFLIRAVASGPAYDHLFAEQGVPSVHDPAWLVVVGSVA